MFKKIILLSCPLFIIAHSYASELERKYASELERKNEELKKVTEELEQVKYEHAFLKKLYDATFSYSVSQEELTKSLEKEVKVLADTKDTLYATNKRLFSLYEKKDKDLVYLQAQLREARAVIVGGDWAIKSLRNTLETTGLELKKTTEENETLGKIAAQAEKEVVDLTDEANEVLGQVRKDAFLFKKLLLEKADFQDELRRIDGLPRKNKTASQSSLQSITEERVELPITNE